MCENLRGARAAALEEAKRSDPALTAEQCTLEVRGGLECGCPTFANPANADALGKMNEAEVEYIGNGCTLSTSCLPCQKMLSARCSSEGRCEDYLPGPYRGCEVGGVRYAIGATGVPDPVSCNTCTCSEGGLECTEINCPRPCPAATGYGKSCAQCGPADDCQVMAFGCYETCVDGCDDIGQVCVDGLCRPGFCG